MRIARLLHASIAAAALLASHAGVAAEPADPAKPRLIVLTDIGNEPDDSMSMVRLLTYANELDIEGLIATTSVQLPDAVHPEMIQRRIKAYGQVLPNLRVHAPGYPDAAQLLNRTLAGSPVYGMTGVGKGKDTAASRLIIAAVDRPDPRPVWVSIWGGAADLAQALWTVRATRTPAQVERFVAKLRVYSISDQDDAGPWARQNFPKLFWITSIHSFTDYGLSTWAGITEEAPGVDQTQVSQPWLDANIRDRGALGALYPRVVFGMEGDTPSFLYLLPNGVGSPEHPDWGSWGGRYGLLTKDSGLWTSAADRYEGLGGQAVASNQATVSRWRSAFQNDFATRMNWAVQPQFAGANHAPQVRLNGAAGQAPVEFAVCAGERLTLTASGSSDPDNDTLTYRWWRYSEAATPRMPLQPSASEGIETTVLVKPWLQSANVPKPPSYPLHVMLEVKDSGTPALTRYRRAIVNVLTGGSNKGRACPVPGVRPPHSFADEPENADPRAFSAAGSSLGEIMDNPQARAVLQKHLPDLLGNPQIEQARRMTLPMVRGFLPELTDAKMKAIDADLRQIPPLSTDSSER